MKILVLNYEYPPLGGGAAPITRDLVLSLSKKNEIDIITMHYKGLEKQEKYKNLNIYRVNCIRTKKESSNFFEMLSFLYPAYKKATELIEKAKKENKNYDLIHCHFIIPTGIIAYFLKKKYKIPFVITSHGSDVPGYNPDRFKILHFILKPIWKKILDNSDKIITPSESLKNLILKNFTKKEKIENKIRVIYNGINLINKKISFDKKEKILLYAGRLFQRKGVQFLIMSADSIPKDWKIYIAGDGPYREDLEILASKQKNKENILFLGWLDKKKLYDLYEKSSIFVLPSSEESFGMVLIEAMMYGNAIITTKGTGTEEVILNSGILINNNKNKNFELIKAIKKLIENKKLLKKYQKESIKRSTFFDLNKIKNEYIREFNFVIKNY